MAELDPAEFARAERAYIVAAAGCGKTELIARAIQSDRTKRQLVLTHTNAGVAALRRRLHRYDLRSNNVKVETITGFALRYAASYPGLSGLTITEPVGAEWGLVTDAALRVLDSRMAKEILQNSFGGVYVDEYQDCNSEHHALIRRLADYLPTRLLGDPLQAIFDFKDQRLVDWEEVDREFERLPDLVTPWRWADANAELGEWLVSVRPDLERGQAPDFSTAPVVRGSCAPAAQVLACSKLREESSVVAIRQWPNDAHEIARKLGGFYTSMDEVEGKDLRKLVGHIDDAVGTERTLNVLGAAAHCLTGVGDQLNGAIAALRRGFVPAEAHGEANSSAIAALRRATTTNRRDDAAEVLAEVARLPGAKVYRRELFEDLRKTLRLGQSEGDRQLTDIAWAIRDSTRRVGRQVDARIVSRNLLVKGLEFDHAIILDASDWLPARKASDLRNLYVAMTRGKSSLTILE